jgi:hypothetical protein
MRVAWTPGVDGTPLLGLAGANGTWPRPNGHIAELEVAAGSKANPVAEGGRVAAFALSWVSAPLALALCRAMALYYAFDQASVPTERAPGDQQPPHGRWSGK